MTIPEKSLRVGVMQLTSVNDVEKNIAQITRLLKRVSGKKLDLLCLPENALFLRLRPDMQPGFGFDLSESFWSIFRSWSKGHNCEILVGSVPLVENGQMFNATIRVSGDAVTAVYRKIHLFDVDVKGAPPARESANFRHGSNPETLEIKGWKIGLTICYDLRFSELFWRYAKSGVHLVVVPSAFLVPTGKAHWHVLLRARAIESQAFVVAAAQSGEHKAAGLRRSTFGHSLAVEPWGKIIHESKKKGPDVFIVDLDPSHLRSVRDQIPMADHRRL